jgi:hypothetical protein
VSINDRLGGGAGQDIPSLSTEYLTDLYILNEQENEQDDDKDSGGPEEDDAVPEWEAM